MNRHTFSRRILWAVLVGAILISGCTALVPAASVQASDASADTQHLPEIVVAQAAPEAPAQPQVDMAASIETELDEMLYMREEEKLAHDVYVTLYELWGLPVFDNIARAENQHMDAVLQLLEVRGIADPAAGNAVGEFTNPELQALYDGLVAQGSASAVAALTVGATIEDLDIADLQSALQSVEDSDIRFVFENLLRGSGNHMRAFVRNLSRYGETYEPQYMAPEDFAEIVGDGSGDWGQRDRGGHGRSRGWQNTPQL